MEENETTWMLDQWHYSKDRIVDADTVWSKMPTGNEDLLGQSCTWQHWKPNREHWWVKDTLEAMPKLRPTIMFRLCTQKCPEKDKFGQAMVIPSMAH